MFSQEIPHFLLSYYNLETMSCSSLPELEVEYSQVAGAPFGTGRSHSNLSSEQENKVVHLRYSLEETTHYNSFHYNRYAERTRCVFLVKYMSFDTIVPGICFVPCPKITIANLFPHSLRSIAWNPFGTLIAAGSSDRTLRVYVHMALGSHHMLILEPLQLEP
jgi:hypothetical protein